MATYEMKWFTKYPAIWKVGGNRVPCAERGAALFGGIESSMSDVIKR